ncbi:MAG: dihydrodipicolinate synthase family protein [Dysgonamonadaceae bacterium]|jgi:4-hydroxy-tetrahydrodipicolinate synthase|nr:dihydrodipicolinate synthase family protein [Dysgonamonadaceae bacterium]
MNKKYQGVVVPMATPLTQKLKTDTTAVRKIMAAFAENNLSPLILGTTGESASVGKTESAVFIETAVKAKQGNQWVYAGLVGNNVEELIERAKRYADLGADVVVSTLPSYYILTPAQMERYYTQLADASPCPVMMYNIKATTQMSLPLETAEVLSRHPNIAGLKDSERDRKRLQTAITTYRDRPDFSFFCGWGAQGLQSLQMGADGIVPSTGNAVPEMYKALYDAFLKQDYPLAEKIQKATDEVAAIYQLGRTLGQSLAALKILMERRGFCQRYMMPPLTELRSEEVGQIQTYKF